MKTVAQNSKLVGHSTEIIQQSKNKGTLLIGLKSHSMKQNRFFDTLHLKIKFSLSRHNRAARS